MIKLGLFIKLYTGEINNYNTNTTSLQTRDCKYVVYNDNMNTGKIKTAKQMERHLKGISNHYRIEILLFIADRDKVTLEDIIREIGANKKTLGEHTRRLFIAGLINKKYKGKFVEHSLSPYGKTFVRFLKSFKNTG